MPDIRRFIRPRILYPLIAVFAAGGVIGYFALSLDSEKSVNAQLYDVLNDTLKEKEQLQARIAETEQQLQEKEQRLAQLSDAAALRASLENAQKMIEQLNADMARLNSERSALQNENLNLSTKIQGLTSQLTRNIGELKAARESLSKTQVAPLQKAAVEVVRASGINEQEAARLRDQIKQLQAANLDLAQKNDVLDKTVKGARQSGQLKPGKTADELERRIAELKSTVDEKDDQIQRLKAQLDDLKDTSRTAGGQQKKVSELVAKNSELARRIEDLEDQLDTASRSARTRPGQDTASREQLNKLTELLVKKELEIDTVRKQALEAQERLVGLQTKLSSLESSVSQSKSNADRVRELETRAALLQGKITDLQQSLSQKAELADSLQKNLSYLTDQLTRKDQEIREAQSRYASADSVARDDLQRARQQYDETNMLYTSLKTQVAQFSDALNLKEAELDQRKRETQQYREEIAALRSRSESLEKDLVDAKERQKKTLDDLVSSVKLNTVLQEKLMGGSQPRAVTPQQQKADALKRRVEIMLEPQTKTVP